VIGETIGRIGRYRWLLRRGRLSWSRIPVS
jgi:hypothetical protein